jgi:quinol monooxygenase YgiN
MSHESVSLHPYFKVRPGNLDAARSLLPRFVEQTRSEPGCLYYGFTIDGDTVFCREAYRDAEATLAHLQNVGALLGEMLQLADLVRLELHGPAAELEKLKAPLTDLKPAWFAYECGFVR